MGGTARRQLVGILRALGTAPGRAPTRPEPFAGDLPASGGTNLPRRTTSGFSRHAARSARLPYLRVRTKSTPAVRVRLHSGRQDRADGHGRARCGIRYAEPLARGLAWSTESRPTPAGACGHRRRKRAAREGSSRPERARDYFGAERPAYGLTGGRLGGNASVPIVLLREADRAGASFNWSIASGMSPK